MGHPRALERAARQESDGAGFASRESHMRDIDHLIFFGDSLSDQTNMHDLTRRTAIVTLPSQTMGYGAAFSNGPVQSGVTAGVLGVTLANYAVGGAKAVGSLTLEGYLVPRLGGQVPDLDIFLPDADPADLAADISLGGQIGRFLADAAAKPVEAGTAAAFLIGLNDYSEWRPTSPETAQAEAAALIQAVLGATIQAAAGAVAAGVETVVLYTMPNVDFFPYAGLQTPQTVALGNQMIAAHNAGLAQGAAALEALGAEAETVDLNRISVELKADAETFGLRGDLFGAPVLLATGGNPRLVEQPDGSWIGVFPPNPATAGVDPDQLAFWDLVHPTAALHGVWGAFSATSLSAKTFFLGAGDDDLRGTRGADLVLAGAGDDRVATGGGADAILGGLGNDRLAGGSGADILAGGAGDDLLRGGCGADVLAGGMGRDRLFGGSGADLLVAGPGCDRLDGGAGDDAFLLVEGRPGGPASGMMIGGGGEDTLYLLVSDAVRAAVEAEWRPGAARQHLDALGLRTAGVEHVVFLDPATGVEGIDTPARIDEAALWGFV